MFRKHIVPPYSNNLPEGTNATSLGQTATVSSLPILNYPSPSSTNYTASVSVNVRGEWLPIDLHVGDAQTLAVDVGHEFSGDDTTSVQFTFRGVVVASNHVRTFEGSIMRGA